jgi:hypothetical protein
MSKIRVLGHIISKQGRVPDPKKVQAIIDLDRPRTPAEAKHILGMISYNREYLHRLAELTAPIFDVAHQDADIVNDWKEEIQGKAFAEVKRQLTTVPTLLIPEMSKPFRIEVDSCLVKAILYQRDPDIIDDDYDFKKPKLSNLGWKPVAYFSKPLTDSERKYGVTEAEAKGMHDSIMHWAPLLLNGRDFTVVVDHQALMYFSKGQGGLTNPRLNKMMLNLQGYRFHTSSASIPWVTYTSSRKVPPAGQWIRISR